MRAVPQPQIRPAQAGGILSVVRVFKQRPRGLTGHLQYRAADVDGQSHPPDARPRGRAPPHHTRLAGADGPLGRFSQDRPAGLDGRPSRQRRRQWRTVLLLRRRLDSGSELRSDEVDRRFPGNEQPSDHRRVSTGTTDRSEPACQWSGPLDQRDGGIERVQGRSG